jgi:Protein of unknown function (DUF3024)
VRVEAVVRGNSVTIFDCRPPWHPNLTEWSKVRVAQLRYSADTHHWSLYWADRNGRWHRYDDLDPGPRRQSAERDRSRPHLHFLGLGASAFQEDLRVQGSPPESS